jgi:hypothetical protein
MIVYRPVDVSSREKEVSDRLDKEREAVKDRLSMSRTNSRQGSERSPFSNNIRTPPPSAGSHPTTTTVTPIAPTAPSPKTATPPQQPKPALAPNVRATLSFANVAANKESVSALEKKVEEVNNNGVNIETVAEKVAEVAI